MKRLALIFKEIKNYFFLRRTIRLHTGSKKWKQFNLRKNWYGRVYTVISLREEDMGEEEVVRNWKAMEMMRPINEYLSSLGVSKTNSMGLSELIFPSIEKIPNSRSYLVVYSPIFNALTFSWVLWRLILISSVIASSLLFNIL